LAPYALQALGHTVRLMPPAYVKPYVKRHKNDAADAEAICEAVTRANMRFVVVKTPEQQSCLMLHRTRHLFIRQQTAVINAIRAHLAEFGIVAPVGRNGVATLLNIVADPSDNRIPEIARACLVALGAQLRALKGTKHRPWLTALLARRPTRVAAIALANKIARMAWAMLAKGECCHEHRKSCQIRPPPIVGGPPNPPNPPCGSPGNY
jgi:transposase